jgi:hypothetical protein
MLGYKAHAIDSEKLVSPLRVFDHGDGHASILPYDEHGKIDDDALADWAASRGQSSIHRFTQIVLDAVVQVVQKERE